MAGAAASPWLALAVLVMALALPLAFFFTRRKRAMALLETEPQQQRALDLIEKLMVTDDGVPLSPASPDKADAVSEDARRVLIVDDDPVTRATLHRLFTQAGFFSAEVEDGQKAVDRYAMGERFHMVVMDHDMPVLNGVDTVKALRKFDRDVCIMALTGNDPTSKEKDFLRVGANFVAPKPVTRTTLKEVLQQYELVNW